MMGEGIGGDTIAVKRVKSPAPKLPDHVPLDKIEELTQSQKRRARKAKLAQSTTKSHFEGQTEIEEKLEYGFHVFTDQKTPKKPYSLPIRNSGSPRPSGLTTGDYRKAYEAWTLSTRDAVKKVVLDHLIGGKAFSTLRTDIGADPKRPYIIGLKAFASILKKLEGQDQTSDEKSYEPILRKITGERTGAAFMMRKSNAEIERLLPNEFKDATCEIEFCYRYLAGELTAVTNLRAYGIVAGGGNPKALEERAIKLMPIYTTWATHLQSSAPAAYTVAQAVIFDGCGLRQAAVRARLDDGAAAGKQLLFALNEYSVRAGWGDVIGTYKYHDPGYVYVVAPHPDGPYKIGYSRQPKRRVLDLQVGSREKLHLIYVMKTGIVASQAVEREVHDYLRSDRIRGEWYDSSLEIIIEALRIIHPTGTDAKII